MLKNSNNVDKVEKKSSENVKNWSTIKKSKDVWKIKIFFENNQKKKKKFSKISKDILKIWKLLKSWVNYLLSFLFVLMAL